MAEKRRPVRRNRGLSNSNTGPSGTNKELQEIYFETLMSCAGGVEKNLRRSNTLMQDVSN
jgi:hypothetical protein